MSTREIILQFNNLYIKLMKDPHGGEYMINDTTYINTVNPVTVDKDNGDVHFCNGQITVSFIKCDICYNFHRSAGSTTHYVSYISITINKFAKLLTIDDAMNIVNKFLSICTFITHSNSEHPFLFPTVKCSFQSTPNTVDETSIKNNNYDFLYTTKNIFSPSSDNSLSFVYTKLIEQLPPYYRNKQFVEINNLYELLMNGFSCDHKKQMFDVVTLLCAQCELPLDVRNYLHAIMIKVDM